MRARPGRRKRHYPSSRKPVNLQRPSAGIGEQASPLFGVEIERSLQHRPRRSEEKEGSGEIEKQRAAAGDPRGAASSPMASRRFSNAVRKVGSRASTATSPPSARSRRSRRVSCGRVSIRPRIRFTASADLEGRGVLARGGLDDGELGECGCRPPQHEAVELFLPAEVVGDRAGVGPREVADVADRRSAVSRDRQRGWRRSPRDGILCQNSYSCLYQVSRFGQHGLERTAYRDRTLR